MSVRALSIAAGRRSLAIARRLAGQALFCTVLAAAQAAAAQGGDRAAKAAADHTAPRGAEPDGYWTGDVDAPTPATLRGGWVIHAGALAALLRHGRAVIVDVSNAPRAPPGLAPGAPWMPLPHRAIPGAVWIPGVGAGSPAPGIEDFFRERLAEATAGDPDRPLVIYCHDRCWLSWNAAKRAIGYGYRRTYWFPEGIEGWIASGRPTATVEPREPAARRVAGTAAGDSRYRIDRGFGRAGTWPRNTRRGNSEQAIGCARNCSGPEGTESPILPPPRAPSID